MAEYSFYKNDKQKQNAFRNRMNEYLMTTGVKAMGFIAATIVIVALSFIWFFYGSLPMNVEVLMKADNGDITLYIRDTEVNWSALYNQTTSVESVNIEGVSCKILSIGSTPIDVMELNDYMRYVGEFEQGEWCYIVNLKGDIPDGISKVNIIVGRLSPAKMLFGE